MEGGLKLNRDVLSLIAQRLECIDDFEAFRLSSRLFSKAATEYNFLGWFLRRNVPYLMAPNNDDSTGCGFFSLAKEEVIETTMLPEAKNKKWLASQGWLLTVETYQEKGLSLLQPFQHREIKLPNQHMFPDRATLTARPHEFIKKIVLSSRPCESSDFAAVVIYGTLFRNLAFWKPGNSWWKRIYAPRRPISTSNRQCILDVAYFDRQFFAIDSEGEIWACDVEGPNPMVGQYVISLPLNGCRPCYIVESSGVLLVVAWRYWIYENPSHSNPAFVLYEVNTVTKTWEEIKDLRGKAVFLGLSASLSTEATRGIKPDHIYYAGNAIEYFRGAWSYNLIEHRFERLYERTSNSPSYPVWVPPTF